MSYFKRVSATIYGQMAEKLKKEVEKRGKRKGVESEIVREALRKHLD